MESISRNMGERERTIIAAVVDVGGVPVAAELVQDGRAFFIMETPLGDGHPKDDRYVVTFDHTAIGIAEAFCRRYGIVVSSRLFEGRAS